MTDKAPSIIYRGLLHYLYSRVGRVSPIKRPRPKREPWRALHCFQLHCFFWWGRQQRVVAIIDEIEKREEGRFKS
jgi:hypothetical protein